MNMKQRSLTADRRNQIARILLQEGSIKVGELAKKFDVSTETIRKDIIWLEKEGIAEKEHGGALIKSDLIERTIDDKISTNSKEKSSIAEIAVSLIPQNGAVILDAGSTNAAIAKELSLMSDLTIITNSLTIANLLANSNNEVYIIGGRVRSSSKAAVGGWTDQILENIHADVAFLGSDGFSGLPGPSAVSYSEADFKKKVIKAASKVYTVADSSKFDNTGLFAYTNWNEISGLITDSNAPESKIEEIKNKTDVIIAKDA